MINAEWNRLFPRSQCIHGLAIGSDHVSITVSLDHLETRGQRAFKFEDMWLQKPKCLDVIKSALDRGGRPRTVEDYNVKIDSCRTELKRWSIHCV